MAYKCKADQTAAARKHYLAHRQEMIDRASEHRKLLRQKVRQHLQELKDNTPCTDCGRQYRFYIMQFDHVDGKKLFCLGDAQQWWSWTRVITEVAKCEIVCSNCHAERTWSRAHIAG